MEDSNIRLDCRPGDAVALAAHKNALAAACALYTSYMEAKKYLIGTGPELFAEQWIFNFVVYSNQRFDDLVLIYFTKILQGAQKNG